MSTTNGNAYRSPFYNGRGIHGELVDSIGRQIVTGEFRPGVTLDLDVFRTERDVSQTALREALRVLAGKGLVEARQKRGTIVREPRGWNLLDPDILRWQVMSENGPEMLECLAEVRSIVEPAAARLAASRRTDDDITALEEALSRMVATADDPRAHAEADVAFHRTIVIAAGNDLLARIVGAFEALLQARDELVHSEGHRHDFEAVHSAVLEAVRDGDGDRAERAMLELLSKASRDALELDIRSRDGKAKA